MVSILVVAVTVENRVRKIVKYLPENSRPNIYMNEMVNGLSRGSSETELYVFKTRQIKNVFLN